MESSTFPLKDFLRKNKGVSYDLASSSVRDISVLNGYEINSYFYTGYTDEYNLELEEKISDFYKGVDDLDIVSLPGAQISNSLVFLASFDHGDEVIVESPNYEPLFKFPKKIGLKVVTFKRRFENGFNIKIEELDECISKKTKAVVITNPHNPSGVFLGEEKLKEIQQYLEDKGVLLVVDEIFRDFVKDGSSALEYGSNVVVTSSFSKIFGMGGIRIGWAATRNKELIEQIYQLKFQMNLLNSTLSEKMVLKTLENRETLLTEVRNLIQRNISMINGWIEGSKNLQWVPPSNVNISFPRLKLPCNSYEFSQRALKEGVLVSPGRFFSKDFDDHIRLCFGMKTQKLALGLQKLSKVIRKWD